MSMQNNEGEGHQKLLMCLFEMRNLEEIVVKNATKAFEYVKYPLAKDVLKKWAKESEEHRHVLQQTIDKLQRKIPTGEFKKMEYISSASYVKQFALEILDLVFLNFDVREMYALFKQHMEIEGHAAKVYAEMAEMTGEKDINTMLLKLSEREKDHHKQAQHIISAIEQTYGDTVKDL